MRQDFVLIDFSVKNVVFSNMLANQLKSAAVADLLHVRKAQQKERAHRLLASGLL